MAPSKSPVFAVCGSVSVDTVVVGVVRRRSSVKTTRRSAVAGLDSLYADLLWDCGGGNVENDVAAEVRESAETAPLEDFTDVFGGPPRFATLSSQLSFKRGMSRVSDACTNGGTVFQPFANDTSSINSTSAYDAFNGHPRLCASQEAHVNPTPLSNSTKLRSTTEAKSSSHICYSDGDKKKFIKCKEGAENRGDEISTTVPPGACAGAKTASTTTRVRESSRSDGGEDAKDTGVLKPSRKDVATMKENIQACSKDFGGELEEQLASVHARMTSSSRGFQEATQKSSYSTQDIDVEGQKHNLKSKKKGNADDMWVTIKDVQFATEPSMFPPPSRPPPGLGSDAAYAVGNTFKAVKRVDDWPKRSSESLQKGSDSDSRLLSSPCTQGPFTKEASNPKDVKDAVEMAEAKIRMVLEARGKAKLMVEKKLREKQRARQHKERIANEGKLGMEQNHKEHTRDLREDKVKLNVRHCEDNVDRQEAEGARKRDIARQCIQRATRDLRSKSEAIIQERRVSHDSSELPVQDGKEVCSAKSAVDRMTAEATPRAGHFRSEINAGPRKGCSRKAELEKVAADENFVSREQQQDSLSSSSYITERQSFSESTSLERVQSMSRSHDDWNLFPGGNSCLIGFREIIGETSERRKARWDRHCRTAARMAKALEEKKLRDLERQKEQAERHRAGEMLDEEIKGWAAGKEGNLEALLCSLHYVLWPDCGWERVSPADLSTAAAVKKAYRRATLCVHPDKVQQKGATVAQKYIAEKIFDLLKEASAKYI